MPPSDTIPKIETETPVAPVTPEPNKPLAANSAAAQFLSSVLGDDSPKPKRKREADEGEVIDKRPPAPKKKAAPAPAPRPAAAIDEEKLGESIGRSIAAHTNRVAEAAREPEPSPEAAVEQAVEDRRIAVLARMESLNAEKYKGLAERYKANEGKLRQRAKEWEKANTGESFADRLEEFEKDPDSYPEFADEAKFASDLEAQSDYADADFERAEKDLWKEEIRREVTQEVSGTLGERVSEIERSKQREFKQQEINSVAYASGNDCLNLLGDEFAAAVEKDGQINREVLVALKEADPVKHDIGVAAMQAAEQGAAVIHMLSTGLEKHNPANPAHAQLAMFARQQERAILARPADNRVNDEGLAFAARDDYERMTPADKRRHFVLSPEDLKTLWTYDVARRAKADLQREDEKFSARAKARGLISDNGQVAFQPLRRSNGPGYGTGEIPNRTGSESSSKPVSPSFSSSPKVATGRPGGKGGPQSSAARFIADVFA